MFLFRSSLALLIVLHFFLSPGSAQDHHHRYESIDVLSYCFEIDLTDTTDVIRARADIDIEFLQDLDQFTLDLTGPGSDTTGMKVHQISLEGKEVSYEQLDNQLALTHVHAAKGTKRSYRITYSGIPSDGLIISENKFGDRTFFGDNWPNRGHHWLPMVDHPSDKALVEFLVHAPEHYKVVSVGTRLEESRKEGRVASHWKTSYPLSSKMMVIGVSPFEVEYLESASGIPVSSWV